MDRKERINEAVKYLKYKGIVKTHEDIAAKMKAGRPSISSALAGKESVLTDNFIARFCATFKQISYTWLLLGEGDMLSSREKTVNDRIRDILKIESLSLQSLSERTGEDFYVLQKCIDDEVEPSEEVIVKFCAALGINEEWIKTGDGEIYDSDQTLINKSALKKHMEALPTRPRLPKNTSDGHLDQYYGKGKKRILCQEKPIITQFVDYDFSLILKNNRMTPKYDRGDDYLLDTAEGAKFKKIKDEGDVVRCISYNKEEFPDFVVPKKLIYGYYRLVGVLRIF